MVVGLWCGSNEELFFCDWVCLDCLWFYVWKDSDVGVMIFLVVRKFFRFWRMMFYEIMLIMRWWIVMKMNIFLLFLLIVS